MGVPIKYPLVASYRVPNSGIYFLDPPGGLGKDLGLGKLGLRGFRALSFWARVGVGRGCGIRMQNRALLRVQGLV